MFFVFFITFHNYYYSIFIYISFETFICFLITPGLWSGALPPSWAGKWSRAAGVVWRRPLLLHRLLALTSAGPVRLHVHVRVLSHSANHQHRLNFDDYAVEHDCCCCWCRCDGDGGEENDGGRALSSLLLSVALSTMDTVVVVVVPKKKKLLSMMTGIRTKRWCTPQMFGGPPKMK